MRELVRLVAVLAFFVSMCLALSAWSGCAWVKRNAVHVGRAGMCCAECIAREWKRAGIEPPAELAPADGGT